MYILRLAMKTMRMRYFTFGFEASFYQLEYIYFENCSDEQRIFDEQIIQYNRLTLVIIKIVYLWLWIGKIFHENLKNKFQNFILQVR